MQVLKTESGFEINLEKLLKSSISRFMNKSNEKMEKLYGDKNINSYILDDFRMNLQLLRFLPDFLSNKNLYRMTIDGSSN